MTLAAIIRQCDREYWKRTKKKTTLSDTEYDSVVERLRAIAPDHPQLEILGG
jgi:NAD-dependent DNA ligase